MHSNKLLHLLSFYNPHWTNKPLDPGVGRDLLSTCIRQLDSPEVLVIKGIRRCGKSTLMVQLMDHLLRQGIAPSRILRVNFEEPLFAGEYSTDLMERIYRLHRETWCPEEKCWLFLDEVQNIPGWEAWVRSRSETEDVKICVTGSSSRMLSREIGTKLTGRHLSFELSPLSFVEFLRFKGISVTSQPEYLSRQSLLRHLFEEYLIHGGFPEVVLREHPEDKKLLLGQYFEDILYRDVATRYEIRDTANLRNLAVYLLTNASSLTSVNKLKNNFAISQTKTENYLSAMLESYLFFQLRKFSFSLKKSLRAGFKPYAVDTGLRNRVAFSFSGNTGHIVENAIFCHLHRTHEDVYYQANGHETDFAVKEGMNITRRIQVWFAEPGESNLPDRETACFTDPSPNRNTAENILITNDMDTTIRVGTATVRCIPALKFLLFDATDLL